MGRVPKYQYGIIGSGKVATHMSEYFTLLGLSYTSWTRHSETAVETALKDCRTVLFLISDSAIEDTYLKHAAFFKTKVCVHFSGQLTIDGIWGAHPLMTFAGPPRKLDFYQEIPFVIEAEAPEFSEFLQGLPNRSVRIPQDRKHFYHALCVMAGNFSNILWQKLFKEFEDSFGFDKSIAFPFLNAVTKNLIENSQTSLTGPLERGDGKSIENNLSALSNDPFSTIYRSFAETYPQSKGGQYDC